MRVLIISAVFPPEPVVSAQISASLALELSKTHEVIVISPRPSRPHGYKFGNDLEDFKCYEHLIMNSYVCSESSLFGRFYESWSFGWRTLQFLIAHDLDVVYCNTWPVFAQALTILATRIKGIKSFTHVQDLYPETLQKSYDKLSWLFKITLGLIDKWTLRSSSGVIAISIGMKDYLVQTRGLNESLVHVVSNWQDENLFLDNRQSLMKNIKQRPMHFMYLGNVGPMAALEELIVVFSSFRESDAILTIAGSGSMLASLKRLVFDEGFTNIHFKDVGDGEVPIVQNKADVLILPMRKGFSSSSIPSKLPAYMLSGKPVLAWVDKLSESANVVIASECGWIIPSGNKELLIQQIEEILNLSIDELNKRGFRAREYALDNFSKTKNLSKLKNIILES